MRNKKKLETKIEKLEREARVKKINKKIIVVSHEKQEEREAINQNDKLQRENKNLFQLQGPRAQFQNKMVFSCVIDVGKMQLFDQILILD